MNSTEEDPLPKYTWWVLGLTAVLLLLLTVTVIGFVSAGAFDPQPVGKLQADLELQTLSVAPDTQAVHWLEALPAEDFSLRLTAAYASGGLDSGYGLLIGNNDGALAVLVSPSGYTAVMNIIPGFPMAIDGQNALDELDGMILNRPDSDENAPVVSWPLGASADSGPHLVEWQRWPHVKTGQEPNEIWLDKRGDLMTIRLNREILVTASHPLSSPIYMGLWLGSFDSRAVIDFQRLQIFAESR